jgi:hypothetical protein
MCPKINEYSASQPEESQGPQINKNPEDYSSGL